MGYEKTKTRMRGRRNSEMVGLSTKLYHYSVYYVNRAGCILCIFRSRRCGGINRSDGLHSWISSSHSCVSKFSDGIYVYLE
jgi:hypothetical protein